MNIIEAEAHFNSGEGEKHKYVHRSSNGVIAAHYFYIIK